MKNKVKLIKTVANSSSYPKKYIDNINVGHIFDANITGRGVKVAVVDTGCDKSHPLFSNTHITGRNFTDEGTPEDFSDLNGHGTHVCGIIAGSHTCGVYGIAPQAELIVCKALDKDGGGCAGAVAKAVNYAVEMGANIINMSLGMPYDDLDVHESIINAVNKGISVVCASGNSGDGNGKSDECDYPAYYEEVISVGAIDDSCSVSKFSNSNKFVDIVAPGENIVSTYLNGDIKQLSGTSMAAPCISGALALLKEWSTKEFGRELGEMELYGELIKNTKTLKCKRTLQGHGMLYLTMIDG